MPATSLNINSELTMIQSQIVFLPIGDKKCGDAIAIRFGELDSGDPSKQTVILVDGGYKDDWSKVYELLNKNFKIPKIDLVISSHLDGDHIGGLPGVVENIPVDNLWMHLPWEHSGDLLASRQSEFKTTGWSKKMEKSLQSSSDLALAADAAGITPEEPFTGKQFVSPFGTVTILGPTPEYYEELLPQIIDKSLTASQSNSASTLSGLAELLKRGIEATAGVFESHHIETLTNIGDTSPSNNSSTVVLIELADGSKKFLLTGDAGIQALEQAASVYGALGHGPGELSFVQVPHHGSRRNVGPAVLDMFLGRRTDHPDEERGIAYVSVGQTCEQDGHPKKVATNAFKRRGYKVFQTRGTGLKHGHPLDGYGGTVFPLPLFSEVEIDE